MPLLGKFRMSADHPHSPRSGTRAGAVAPRRRAGAVATALCTVAAATGLALAVAPAANAAGEAVNIWLTTTSDARGTVVTRGLQQQSAIAFGPAGGTANQTITVNEDNRFQTFEGGGASITDTTAWLLRGSGVVSAATRDDVMRRLFDPNTGIGLSFVRNPIGASDLSRPGMVSLDMTCCDLNDFSMAYDTDVGALTAQARGLNPALRVKAVPWSSPAWMKDNNRMDQMGWLRAEYYSLYAQYFVRYIQSYQTRGVPINYISVQNEPNCCQAGNPTAMNYPGMSWNASGLIELTKNHIFPAFRAAGITTKVLVHDWNYGDYAQIASPILADSTLRNDPLFGGIAWHGYFGDPATGTSVHNQYPALKQFSTEHSGGTWITNQQTEDMNDLVTYARNWSGSLVKWSLGVDQTMGPHNGGCGTCTGLITIQNGGSRSGQVDLTVEYYTMGHLTKFVRPGAQRIDSTANGSVINVAYRNTDGSKALIAYNTTGGSQSVRVNWGDQSFIYTLPTKTSATFTWTGTQSGGGGGASMGPITGLAGKCVDVAGANPADGTTVQLYTCNGTGAQRWTRGTDGTVRALGKCLEVSDGSTTNGARVRLWTCNGSGAQQWTYTAARDLVNPQANKCLDVTGNNSADGTALQIWTCGGGANQKWDVPA